MKTKNIYYVGVAMTLGITLSLTSVSGAFFAKQQENQNNHVIQTKQDEKSSSRSSKKQTQKEYDKEQLEGYLTGAGFTEEDNLKISQKFSVDENTEVSYVFSGDDVIGSYTTTEVNGEKMSSFTFDSTSDEVRSIYEETSDLQDELNKEIRPIKTDNNKIEANEEDESDVYDYVKKAYKKGQRIGFRNCNEGQVFFHGKKAEFVSGKKQGKEYKGKKENCEELNKIVLNPVSKLVVLGQVEENHEENQYCAPVTANNPFGLDASNNYKFYLSQDVWNSSKSLYIRPGTHLGYYFTDRDGIKKTIDQCQYYNLSADLSDYVTCLFKTKAQVNKLKSNNGVSSFKFLPTTLRKNYAYYENNKTYTMHWEFLKGKAAEGGLCWCASLASILSYFNKTYTTKDMYNKLYNDYLKYKNNPSKTPNVLLKNGKIEDPVGSNEWMFYGLNTIGGLNYQLTENYTRINNTCVKKNLNNGYPIIMGIAKYNPWDLAGNSVQGGGGAHSIVLCGVYNNNGSLYYVYMDPNNASNGYTVNRIPSCFKYDNRTDEKFYVVLGTSVYNSWGKVFSRYK